MLLEIVNEGDKVIAVLGEKIGLQGRVTKIVRNFQCRNSSCYQIIWQGKNHKFTEEILKVNENGLPLVANPVLLLDRDYIIGTRVVNERYTHGTILGIEKVATLIIETLDKSPTEVKLEKIPLKLLKRPLEAEIGGKFLWNDWLGKIQDMTVRVVYYFEDSDAVCSISGEEKRSTGNQSHKYPFPFIGQELPSLSLSQLWDADWENNKWFRNIFKYWGKKVKVVNVMIDSITPEWIKRIPNNDLLLLDCDEVKEKSELPKFLLNDDLGKVQQLYGNEYIKMEEGSLCKYSIQGTDQVTIINSSGPQRKTALEYSHLENRKLELSVERVFTIENIWNRYFIEWSNGIQEFCYVQEHGILATAVDPANISLIKLMSRGSIVEMQDSESSDEDSKYGIVLGEDPNRIVTVKWVIFHGPAVHVMEMENSRYDLKFSERYQFLEDLSCSPIVFVKTVSEVGVVIELDVENATLKVKLPTGKEIFPYIHECTHMHDEPVVIIKPCEEDEAEDCITDEYKNMDKIDLEQLSFDPCTHKSGYHVSEQIDDKNIFYDFRFNPRINDYKYLVALEKELASFDAMPEGIWVQGFANRSDLFTAVIRGRSGTPYQDALLVFDLALPQDFPMAVPNVIFRSFGVEINPKILITGEVILPTYDELVPLPSVNKNPCIIRSTLSWIMDEILVNDPYYLVCQNGRNSGDTFVDVHCKRYNEFILLNLLTYQQKIVNNLPSHWEGFFMKYYCENLPKMVEGYESLLLRGGLPEESNVSERGDSPPNTVDAFHISLRSRLDEIWSSSPFLDC